MLSVDINSSFHTFISFRGDLGDRVALIVNANILKHNNIN